MQQRSALIGLKLFILLAVVLGSFGYNNMYSFIG